MPRCMVFGCRNSHTQLALNCSFHKFPTEPDRIREWLLSSGDDFVNIEAAVQVIQEKNDSISFRLCSDHFEADMFTSSKTRKRLQFNAKPTLFKKPKILQHIHEMSAGPELNPFGSKTSNLSAEVECPLGKEAVVQDHDYVPGQHYTLDLEKSVCHKKTQTSAVVTSNKSVSTVPNHGKRKTSTQTDFALTKDVYTTTFDLIKQKTIWTWTGLTQKTLLQEDKATNTECDKRAPAAAESGVPPDAESGYIEIDLSDEDFLPEGHSTDVSDISFVVEPNPEDFVAEKKFLVFETCLDKLISWAQACPYSLSCAAPITSIEKTQSGTLLIVHTVCKNNHRCEFWRSQPMIGNRACGNILASASVLLSGSHFAKVSEMFALLGTPFISQAVHCLYQKIFLFPVVDFHYKQEHQRIIDGLKGKPLCLSGDGQCDSPGFNAKYCTYSLLEEKSQKIIECNVIQGNEATSSVTMESRALARSLDQILAEQLMVAVVVTDRHVSVLKLMKERYADIKHQFDVGRYCRNLQSKLAAICKQSVCKELIPWQNSIISHMWSACSSCKGDPTLLKEKWQSLLHHIINKHSWDSGTVFHKCEHGEYADSAPRSKKWLNESGSAYSKLCSFVKDEHLEEDFQHLVEFCQPGSLEVFHNLLLKFRPKHVHFSLDGTLARTQLAVLAHNANVAREQAGVQEAHTGAAEDSSYKGYFSKLQKEWKTLFGSLLCYVGQCVENRKW